MLLFFWYAQIISTKNQNNFGVCCFYVIFATEKLTTEESYNKTNKKQRTKQL